MTYIDHTESLKINVFSMILTENVLQSFFFNLWDNCYRQQLYGYITDIAHAITWDRWYESLTTKMLQNIWHTNYYFDIIHITKESHTEQVDKLYNVHPFILCSNVLFLLLFIMKLLIFIILDNHFDSCCKFL